MQVKIRTAMEIVIDGKIKRFPTNEKPSDQAGYYCFFLLSLASLVTSGPMQKALGIPS